MQHVDLANVACGFHASDPSIMRQTVRLANQHRVKVGAHPSLPDLQGFGRRRMNVTPEEVTDFVTYQIGALKAFLDAEGMLQLVVGSGGVDREVLPALGPERTDGVAGGIEMLERREDAGHHLGHQ
jgi:lactam utilization protein B